MSAWLFESLRISAILVSLGLIFLGCQGDGEEPVPSESAPQAGAQAPAGESAPPAVSPVASVAGEATFEVGGEPRVFDYLPSDENYYGRISSTIFAKPDRGATEELRITFFSIDLRDVEIPGELPPADAGMRIETAMQNVGFSYTDKDGEEWAGPGRIHVESFGDDGTMSATFSGVTLPHTDKEHPDISLTNGSVTTKLE